ncbi:MAG: DUF1566 domain-containing protein [Desulfamplus sp.]|nr:DUF1566 domain-containing protein [Desulfamplus sp.]MBF0390835.1 DUF1566 domain-containing protein [Desulfamplus sp.]
MKMKMSFVIVLLLTLTSQVVFADSLSDADRFFHWAEAQYSQFFSPANQTSQTVDKWYFRYYPVTNSYIGLNTVSYDVYVVGDIFGGLAHVDSLQALMTIAGLVDNNEDEGVGNCELDENGLMWEIKSNDPRNFRYIQNTYSWYIKDSRIKGYQRESCDEVNQGYCDTQQYIDAVNEMGLCGYSDWRLPTRNETLSRVKVERVSYFDFIESWDPIFQNGIINSDYDIWTSSLPYTDCWGTCPEPEFDSVLFTQPSLDFPDVSWDETNKLHHLILVRSAN